MRAPVAVFVYNRLDNTRQTLTHLYQNLLAKETDVFVFSDGGKDDVSWTQVNEVRQYLHELKAEIGRSHLLKSLTLIERPQNIYLERNIIEGIAQVLETFDRVIVLEDDICTAPYFLKYMNDALDTYEDVDKVMHVSAFTNLDLLGHQNITNYSDIYFTPHMSGWGWATWRNRWHRYFRHYKSRGEALQGMTVKDIDRIQYGGVFPCLKSLDKQPIPWDICWELAIYKAGGLCVTPIHTLVRNIGLKQGTHFRSFEILQHYEFDREPTQSRLVVKRNDNPAPVPEVEALFATAITNWGIRYTLLGKIVRFFYLKFIKKS